MYSPSEEDLEITYCLLHFQLMRFDPKKKIKHAFDLLVVGQAPESKFVNLVMMRFESCLKKSFEVGAFFMYFIIIIVAYMCVILGSDSYWINMQIKQEIVCLKCVKYNNLPIKLLDYVGSGMGSSFSMSSFSQGFMGQKLVWLYSEVISYYICIGIVLCLWRTQKSYIQGRIYDFPNL